jgi:hypothetical protein
MWSTKIHTYTKQETRLHLRNFFIICVFKGKCKEKNVVNRTVEGRKQYKTFNSLLSIKQCKKWVEIQSIPNLCSRYTYIHTPIHIHTHTHIYIYRERKRLQFVAWNNG